MSWSSLSEFEVVSIGANSLEPFIGFDVERRRRFRVDLAIFMDQTFHLEFGLEVGRIRCGIQSRFHRDLVGLQEIEQMLIKSLHVLAASVIS